ncbi:MAG: NUDIX domain-containing protein, partial [Planctomycetota bacterium]
MTATDPTRTPEGYRLTPTGGPAIRADVVDLYVFRVRGGVVELLQLERNKAPMDGSWQPVMGHVEPGERAHETAIREADEEIALDVRSGEALGFWALEQVYPYYLPTLDCIVMSPRFVVQVG